MATRIFLSISLLAVMLGTAGCGVTGLLYTDVTEPLTLNMRDTPVGSKTGISKTKELSYPFTALSVSWDSSAIGDAMKAQGLTKAYFADLRTESVLLGLWSRQTVIVSGE